MPQVKLVNGGIRKSLDDWHGTIAEAEKAISPEGFLLPTIAVIDGEPVLRKDGGWDNLVPEGKVLLFIELPMGGKKGSGMVVQIVATVVAIAATWYLGGAGGALVGALGQTGANIAAGVAAMAIMTAGSMLSNAITGSLGSFSSTSSGQITQGQAEVASPTYSINASGNMARIGQPEPEGFGRMRIVPDYASQPYTSYSANEEWGYFIYTIGRGNYDIESMSFGDTIFWMNGGLVPSSLTVSTSSTSSDHSNTVDMELTRNWSSTFYISNATDNPQTCTLTVHYPNGLYTEAYSQAELESQTGTQYKPLSINVDVRFSLVDENDNPVGGWQEFSKTSRTASSADAFTETYNFNVPFAGRVAMQVKRSGTVAWYKSNNTKFPSYNFRSWVCTGSTVIAGNAQVEFIAPGGRVNIFDDNIYTCKELSNVNILATNQDGYNLTVGPYSVCPSGSKVNRIFIDYMYERGLAQYNKDGTLESFGVTFRVEYQRIDDNGNAVGSWVSEYFSNTARTTTPQRFTVSISVPEGRYQVRMIRTTSTSLDSTRPSLDALVWTSLRGHILSIPRYPVSCVAVKIRASNALSQRGMQSFSLVATRKLPVYDVARKTWSAEQPTRSWAAAVCAACKESWGGGMTDAGLDLQTLWEIDARLQAKGWYFDAYIDGAFSMWQLIQEMCQCMLVVPRMIGTKLSAVEDKAGRPVCFSLSPRNLVRDSFSVTYGTWSVDTPDAIIMNYLDKTKNWRKLNVEARLPNSETTDPVSLDWIGITDRTHAFRIGTGYVARNRYRRITVTCQVEGLGRIVNIGDVVQVNHPRFKNTGGGKVTGFNYATLELDVIRDFNVEDGGSSYVSVTLPDGAVFGPCRIASSTDGVIKLNAADYAEASKRSAVSLESLVTLQDFNGVNFSLHSSSSFQRRMLVQSVTVDDLWHYTLTLVNDAPEVDAYNNLPVPAWSY